jgi:hypothetical protein
MFCPSGPSGTPAYGFASGDLWYDGGPVTQWVLNSLAVQVLLVDRDEPWTVLAEGAATTRGYQFILASAEAARAFCENDLVVAVSNGLQSEPLAVSTSGPCGTTIDGPMLEVPAGDPPITVWGHVYHAERGTLEFYAPADTLAPVHVEHFGTIRWSAPDPNFADPDYVTTLGLEPGEALPDGACSWLVRARDEAGRFSALRPLLDEQPEECGGLIRATSGLAVVLP